jgi:autotransporter-associated beta strand protein
MKQNEISSMKLTSLMAILFALPVVVMAQTTVFNDTFSSGSTLTNTSPAYPTMNSTAYQVLANKALSGNSIAANNLAFGSTGSGSAALAELQALFATTPVTLSKNGDYVQFTTTFTNVFALTTAYGAGTLEFGMYNSGQVLPYPGGGNILGTAGPYTGYAQGWLATSSGYQNGVLVGTLATTMGALTATVYTNVLTIMMNSDNTNSLAITNSLYDNTGALLAQSGNVATNATYVTNAFDSLAIGYYGASPAGAVMHISRVTVTESLAGSPGPLFTVTGGGTGCPGDSVVVGLSGSVATNDYYLLTNGVANGSVVTGTGSAISFPAETVMAVALTNTVLASNTVSGYTGLMIGSVMVAPVAGPVIATQPSPVVVATNNIGVFVVVASGSGLNYQWYRNGSPLTDGGDMAGSGTSTLVISPATTADAATTTQGYYCVITNSCGFSAISTTNSLTLAAPGNIVWQGGNPNTNWDLATTANFTNSVGSVVVFNNGDNVTLDDSSVNPAVTIVGNYIAPTLVTESASQNYSLAGGAITGSGALLMKGSGTLTLSNANAYAGGTTISNGTLKIRGYDALGSGTVTLAGGTLDIPIAGSA